jgi:choline kinase
LSTSRRADKEKKAWSKFKLEILKLAHTLKLKGWRGIPFEYCDEVEVERLSGALTNAVYVVSPPREPPPSDSSRQHRKPDKLLLRIYGPQVEHLIDRENELNILCRLARQHIGPRLLGTFQNGRFEEFFNAQTLRPEDIRDPSTSKQIAKRMRELHDGIELEERERDDGPFVWMNWDKWVGQCEQVITYLDKEIKAEKEGNGEGWRHRGYICGVEWPLFRATVEKYRKWLNERYDKSGGLAKHLVFAHNDVCCFHSSLFSNCHQLHLPSPLSQLSLTKSQTQYGNILRLVPEPPKDGSTPSPLLLPQNTHRQLIVIDFEYASANTRGLEFANHFTEWCYNYHDEKKPWKCDTTRYPTPEEQERFLKSYVNHRPPFNASNKTSTTTTPKMNPVDGGGKGSISEFFLDARTPGGIGGVLGAQQPGNDYEKEEREREVRTEERVQFLLNEAKWWRVANSAQWVAWGIVQAKVPELEEKNDKEEGENGVEGEEKSVEKDDKSTKADTNGDNNNNNTTSTPTTDQKVEEEVNPASSKEVKGESPAENNTTQKEEVPEEEEAEFDYLAYAQDRAMFFWGDVVTLGLIDKEELPQKLRDRLKVVEY